MPYPWNKGIPATDEQKAKFRDAKLGTKASDATKAKMSASHKARYANGYSMPEESMKRSSLLRRGRVTSEEARRKQSAAKKGKPGVRTGIPQSPETIKRMSQNARLQWENMTEEQKATKTDQLRKSTENITKSTLEEVIAVELDAQGMVYERQKKIGWYRVDFYIPSTNTIIEAHGCYWHACEQCSEERHKEKRVADEKRHGYLLRKGYTLRVIWEHERKSELRQFRRKKSI